MVKESTKAMWKLNGGWRHPILFLHAYVYLAHTEGYVNFLVPLAHFLVNHFPPIFGRALLGRVQPYYHSKVVITPDAKRVVTLNKDICIDDSVGKKVVTYDLVRQIIFENPDHITGADCPCRKHYKGCSSAKYGLSMCMSIGEPQASFVLEHSKLNPVKLTPQMALDRLDDYHKNGFVHTMWFKNAMGNRSYAFCNCCKCCCGGMRANNILIPKAGYPKPLIISSGYLAVTDQKKCKGCLTCVKFCPFNARRIDPATLKSETIFDKCHGCGVCIDKCPNGALTLVVDAKKGIPLNIDKLKEMRA
jgi:Pyruvate/2-oxoacid:ferredoxin oxidoreductase delta subunit